MSWYSIVVTNGCCFPVHSALWFHQIALLACIWGVLTSILLWAFKNMTFLFWTCCANDALMAPPGKQRTTMHNTFFVHGPSENQTLEPKK